MLSVELGPLDERLVDRTVPVTGWWVTWRVAATIFCCKSVRYTGNEEYRRGGGNIVRIDQKVRL